MKRRGKKIKTKKVYRSAISGKFVTKKYERKKGKKTTIKQTVKIIQ